MNKLYDNDLKPDHQTIKTLGLWIDTVNLTVKKLLDHKISVEPHNPQEITPEDFETLAKISSSGFGVPMGFEDVRDHITESDEIYIIKEDWEIRGFSSIKIVNDIVYRYWTVMGPELQWKWVYTELNRRIFENTSVMFLRTQNMNVLSAHQHTGRRVFLWSEAMQFLEKYISRDDFSHFFWNPDFENGIFRGAYGWYLWSPERVRFITDDDYPWFHSENGDALLAVIAK